MNIRLDGQLSFKFGWNNRQFTKIINTIFIDLFADSSLHS